MSNTGNLAEIERYGEPALLIRMIGWAILGAMTAFLINNVLIVGFDFPEAREILSGNVGAIVTAGVYVVCIVLAVFHVLRSKDTALRWDADVIHRINMYIVRGFYFGILYVGIADITIAFMRVEKIFGLFLDMPAVRLFERPDFLGLYVHLPLVVLGFVTAWFSRSLGFLWLSLLIILAELSIVITRFVFSYEQAFMGDLVRYWYSALFLLASAYTLFEEGHVRVDILYSNLSRRTKGLFNVFGALLLGIPTAAVVIGVGFAGKQSIINSPVMNFEVTQTGGIGLYVKYQMAAFLGIFGITMLIEFIAMLFEWYADWRDEPGHREPEAVSQ